MIAACADRVTTSRGDVMGGRGCARCSTYPQGRNSDGRGKRTTDLIRLLTDADQDEIEARARGETVEENEDVSTSISPSSQQGLNPPTETVSPAPALGQPLQCGEGLISEPEPESSPQPPSGGPTVEVKDEVWEEFVKAWGDPIPKMARARTNWDRVDVAKRPTIVTAARGYWAWLKAHTTKPPTPASAQSFIHDEAGWEQWLRYAPKADGTAASIASAFPLGSPEAKAIITAYELGNAGTALQFMIRGGAVNYLRPMTPRLLALAQFAGPRDGWKNVLGKNQAAAWEHMLREVIAAPTRRPLREGDHAPYPWPPRKDGTLSTAGPETLMSAEDENFEMK
jgi:hypothetical protein